MSCSCKELKGYDAAVKNALAYEAEKGAKAAIFAINNVVSFTDLTNIKKVKDICCYSTTDGKEHEIAKPVAKEKKTTK